MYMFNCVYHNTLMPSVQEEWGGGGGSQYFHTTYCIGWGGGLKKGRWGFSGGLSQHSHTMWTEGSWVGGGGYIIVTHEFEGGLKRGDRGGGQSQYFHVQYHASGWGGGGGGVYFPINLKRPFRGPSLKSKCQKHVQSYQSGAAGHSLNYLNKLLPIQA